MKALAGLVLLVCFTLFATSEVRACLCKPESVKRAVKRLRKESTAIFVGTVKNVNKKFQDGTLVYRATFDLTKSWKSTEAGEVVIYTTGGCSAWFEVGRTYLVYAVDGGTGALETDICMRTRIVEHATEDLQRLGKPKFSKGK